MAHPILLPKKSLLENISDNITGLPSVRVVVLSRSTTAKGQTPLTAERTDQPSVLLPLTILRGSKTPLAQSSVYSRTETDLP